MASRTSQTSSLWTTKPPKLVPSSLHISGYVAVLRESHILRWLANTVVVAAGSGVLFDQPSVCCFQAAANSILYFFHNRGHQLTLPVLNGFLGGAKELPVPRAAVTPRVQIEDCSANSQAGADAVRAAAHAVARQPSWAITSVTERRAS